MKTARFLSPQVALQICFGLIGVGHVAALWFELYRLVTLSLLAAVVIACWSGRAQARRMVGIGPGLLLACPIYIYALVSTLWSPDSAIAFRDAVYMCMAVAPAIALGLLMARRYTGLQIAQAFGVMLIPFAFQAVASMVERGDPMLIGNGSMRSILGSIICLTSPILAGAWVLTKQRRFVLLGLIAAAFAVTMESRSVILFAAPSVLVSLYFQDRRLALRLLKRWGVPLLLVAVFASSSLLARFASDATSLDISESVFEELQKPSEDRVDFDRRLTTLTATTTFLENPLLGRGYASILQIHEREFGLEISAHGLLPGTLSELGLFGMGVLLWTLWRVISRARKTILTAKKDNPMLIHFLVGFGAVLVLGLFHQTIESVFFGLMIGLLIGFGTKLRSKRNLPRLAFHPTQASASSK